MVGASKAKTLAAVALLILSDLSECSIQQHRGRALKRYDGAMASKTNNKGNNPDDSSDPTIPIDGSGDYPSNAQSRGESQKPSPPKSGDSTLNKMKPRKPKFMNSRRSYTKGSMRRSETLVKSEQHSAKPEQNVEVSEDESGSEMPLPSNTGRLAGVYQHVEGETNNATNMNTKLKVYQSSDVAETKIDPFVLEFVLSAETDVPSDSDSLGAFAEIVNFLRIFLNMIYDDAFISVEGRRISAKFTNGHPRIGVAPTVGFVDGTIAVRGKDVAAVVKDAFTDASALQYFVEHLQDLEEPNVFRNTVKVIYLSDSDNETVAAVQIPNSGYVGPLVGVALALCVTAGVKAKSWRK